MEIIFKEKYLYPNFFFYNIQKTKIVANDPITKIMASFPLWQIDGETMETVTDFIFVDSKNTADGVCSHEIKRCLLFGRKVMINLDSILKSRNITLPTKVCIVKGIVFSVVMYGYESWTIRKAECWRIDAFELWCWRKLFYFFSGKEKRNLLEGNERVTSP